MSAIEGYESSTAETCPGAFDSNPCSSRTSPAELPPLHGISARSHLSPYCASSSSHETLFEHARQQSYQYHVAESLDHMDLNESLDDITPRTLNDEWSETSPYCSFRPHENDDSYASPSDIPASCEQLSACNLSLDLMEGDAISDSATQVCDFAPLESEQCSRVTAAVRIRPFTKKEIALNAVPALAAEDKQVMISARLPQTPRLNGRKFCFDHVFWPANIPDAHCPPATQEMVFETLGHPIISNVVRGYNACLMCYGQTGSGKTYTMTGTSRDPGIIPRCAAAIFDRLEEQRTTNRLGMYTVQMSYIEIYKEKVYDLLTGEQSPPRRKSHAANDGPKAQRMKSSNDSSLTPHRSHQQALRVREHPVRGAFVEGLSQHVVHCGADIMNFIKHGNEMRSTANTSLNERSSRSHAIVTLEVTQQCLTWEGGQQAYSSKASRLHLVDLAGSERMYNSKVHEARFQEMTSTNLSLCTLSRVIEILSENSTHLTDQLPPYRDSMLTWLLVDAFGGNSRTIFIATVSPAISNLQETIATLRYATRARRIINRPQVNEDPRAALITALQQEGQALRKHLMELTSQPSSPNAHNDQLQKKLDFSEQLIKELKQHEEWERRQWESKFQQLYAQQEARDALHQAMCCTQEDLEHQLDEARREIHRLTEEVAALQQALSDRESDVAQLAAEQWRLHSMLEAKELEASKQQRQVDALRHELEGLRAQTAEMAAQLHAQEAECNQTETFNAQLEAKLSAHLLQESAAQEMLITLGKVLCLGDQPIELADVPNLVEKSLTQHDTQLEAVRLPLEETIAQLKADANAMQTHYEAILKQKQEEHQAAECQWQEKYAAWEMKEQLAKEQLSGIIAEYGAKLLACERNHAAEKEELIQKLQAMEKKLVIETSALQVKLSSLEQQAEMDSMLLQMKTRKAEEKADHAIAEHTIPSLSREKQWEEEREALLARLHATEMWHQGEIQAQGERWHEAEEAWQVERGGLKSKLAMAEKEAEEVVAECRKKLQSAERQWEAQRSDLQQRYQAEEQRLEDKIHVLQAKLQATEQTFEEERVALQGKLRTMETCHAEQLSQQKERYQEAEQMWHATQMSLKAKLEAAEMQAETMAETCRLKLFNGETQWQEERTEMRRKLQVMEQRMDDEAAACQAKLRAAEQQFEADKAAMHSKLQNAEACHQEELAYQRDLRQSLERRAQEEAAEWRAKLLTAEKHTNEITSQNHATLLSYQRQWDEEKQALHSELQTLKQKHECEISTLQAKLQTAEQQFAAQMTVLQQPKVQCEILPGNSPLPQEQEIQAAERQWLKERAGLETKIAELERQLLVPQCTAQCLAAKLQWDEETAKLQHLLQATEHELQARTAAAQAELQATREQAAADMLTLELKLRSAEAQLGETKSAAEKHSEELLAAQEQLKTAQQDCVCRMAEIERQKEDLKAHYQQRLEAVELMAHDDIRKLQQQLEEVVSKNSKNTQVEEHHGLEEGIALQKKADPVECHMKAGEVCCVQDLSQKSTVLGSQQAHQTSKATQTMCEELSHCMSDALPIAHPEVCDKQTQTIDDGMATSSRRSSISLENVLARLDSDDGAEVNASNAPEREMARHIINGGWEEEDSTADTHLVEAIVAEYTKLLQSAVQDRPEWKELFDGLHLNIQAVSGKPTISWLSWLTSGPSSTDELAAALRRQEALSTRAAAWLAGLQAQREVMRHTVAAQVRINSKLARERTALETEVHDLKGRLERACYVLRRLHEERSGISLPDEPIPFICPKCHEESTLLATSEP